MNVLCLGAQIIGPQVAFELVHAFLAARFAGEERYRRRWRIEAMERASARLWRTKQSRSPEPVEK
jgi:ribose 5-phosphate isomerase RpiB